MSVKKPAHRPPPPMEFEPMGAPANGDPATLAVQLTVQFTVHSSETPSRRRAALLKALRARRIPGRLLYRSAEQARRWLDYHSAWSPSRTDPSLGALYRRAAGEMAAEMSAEMADESGGEPPPLLVGLGCGDGAKDAEVLAALAKGGGEGLAYAPVDASPELVLRAANQAVRRVPGVALHPLVADLSAEPPLSRWLPRARWLPQALWPLPSPCPPLSRWLPQALWPPPSATGSRRRLFTAYGLLPNLHHRAFPRWLAGLAGPDDRLLVSANLFPGAAADASDTDTSNTVVKNTIAAGILAQYDNPLARRWYAGCLSELGIPGKAYHFSIESLPLEDQQGPLAGAFQVVVRAHLKVSVRVKTGGAGAGGEEIVYQAGERLTVFHSNRFTAGAVQLLLEQAGLAVTRRWIHASGEEGIFACRRP
ncbi:MAG: L-histidine N(alpha)-methyltransferase [bacterium]